MRPAPRLEVRDDQLWCRGRVVQDTLSLWWELGPPETFQGGEEYGEYHACWGYPSRGIEVEEGELGITRVRSTRD